MQKYCHIDYDKVLSIVAILQQGNIERIVAEGRYAEYASENTHEIAFLVDEEFQGKGVGGFLMNYIIRIARDRNIPKLSASVLAQNQKMLKQMQKVTGGKLHWNIAKTDLPQGFNATALSEAITDQVLIGLRMTV